jgi:enoyl-CoA hydratase
MIIAADDTHLAYSEIYIGLVPVIHFTYLPKLIGRYRAFELLFSGRMFDAAEGERLGLINRIVPRAALIDEAYNLAAQLAAKSSALMRIGRAAFMRANDLDYRRSMEDAAAMICALVGSPDMQEGFSAFLEQRTPKWPSMPAPRLPADDGHR